MGPQGFNPPQMPDLLTINQMTCSMQTAAQTLPVWPCRLVHQSRSICLRMSTLRSKSSLTMRWAPPKAWVPLQGHPHLAPLLLLHQQHLQQHRPRSRRPMPAGRRVKGTRRGSSSSRHSRPSRRLLPSVTNTLQRIMPLQVMSDCYCGSVSKITVCSSWLVDFAKFHANWPVACQCKSKQTAASTNLWQRLVADTVLAARKWSDNTSMQLIFQSTITLKQSWHFTNMGLRVRPVSLCCHCHCHSHNS